MCAAEIKKGEASLSFCDSDRIHTCNLLIRSQMLYSVELRSHLDFVVVFLLKSGAKVLTFQILTKFFFVFFGEKVKTV